MHQSRYTLYMCTLLRASQRHAIQWLPSYYIFIRSLPSASHQLGGEIVRSSDESCILREWSYPLDKSKPLLLVMPVRREDSYFRISVRANAPYVHIQMQPSMPVILSPTSVNIGQPECPAMRRDPTKTSIADCVHQPRNIYI